ncbi:MAG: DUF1934 domain-containing protein [Clostridiales bacterium]|nr:DUF1934 domain-containing protein [Clostridiales bacterium]
MEKEVIIDIVAKQKTADNEDTMSVTTVGTFSGNEDDYKVVYSDMEGELAGSTTTLRVQNKEMVTMTRDGSYSSQLIIEKQRRHNCHYMTPYGELVMGVFAKDVKSEVDENGGKLEFKYTIDFNSGLVCVNHMTISIKGAN